MAVVAESATRLVLDVNHLDIQQALDAASGAELKVCGMPNVGCGRAFRCARTQTEQGEAHPAFGSALTIALPDSARTKVPTNLA